MRNGLVPPRKQKSDITLQFPIQYGSLQELYMIPLHHSLGTQLYMPEYSDSNIHRKSSHGGELHVPNFNVQICHGSTFVGHATFLLMTFLVE